MDQISSTLVTLLSSIPSTTLYWLATITLLFLFCFIVVIYFRKKDKLVANRRLVEYFPTFVSTLGVLGTFYGITVGLIHFDPTDLDVSIPELLDGLKTAFFTSLAGMIESMILSAFISRQQDKKEGGISDINQAASTICNAVQSMSDANRETLASLKAMFEEQEKDRKDFYRSVGNVLDKVSSSQTSIVSAVDNIVDISRNQESILSNVQEQIIKVNSSLDKLGDDSSIQTKSLVTIASQTESVGETNRNIGEILNIVSRMGVTQTEINNQVQKLKDILDAEVVQIEQSMDKTNLLLERKFNEFTELLKRSNTEALVEVMKRVTEEFQTQMNALINKLIQENFDELNKSVERLNTWQHENKDMISSLTQQYKQMSENFEATSESLTKVKDDTETLVCDGSKLHQIVDALNEVIVNDEKFIKTADHLQKAAEISQASLETLGTWQHEHKDMISSLTQQYKQMSDDFEATSESLTKVKVDTETLVGNGSKLHQIVDALNVVIVADEKFIKTADHLQKAAEISQANLILLDASAKHLSDWIRKQRKFADSVDSLIEKLDEIGKIKDYNEQFWSGTKKSLEEGVGFIKEGSKTLRSSLTDIDRHFYTRLSSTLAELDTCIQAMIKGRR